MCECHNDVENGQKLTCYKLVVEHTNVHKFSHTANNYFLVRFLKDSSLFLNSMAMCSYALSALEDIPESTFLHYPTFGILDQG